MMSDDNDFMHQPWLPEDFWFQIDGPSSLDKFNVGEDGIGTYLSLFYSESLKSKSFSFGFDHVSIFVLGHISLYCCCSGILHHQCQLLAANTGTKRATGFSYVNEEREADSLDFVPHESPGRSEDYAQLIYTQHVGNLPLFPTLYIR